ncbi:hypothetical protein ACIPSE_34305 [Streptomyces sp. NPDC090106]|uniref:hypothetical protein n=1 Tax=Streptomyces sp. NPDC090106 TaxID=3365946 RepID=UPI0037F686D8
MDPESQQQQPRRRRFHLRPWQTVIAAVITAFAAVVTAFLAAGGGPEGQTPATSAFPTMSQTPTQTRTNTLGCEFPAVELSAPEQAGSTFQTTAKLNCSPPAGTKYYLVAQLDNFGDPGTEHTIYCPKDPIKAGQPARTYTATRDISKSELHSKRTMYYLKVTNDQEQELLANLQDDCAFELPSGVETVSNSVTVERAWK